MFDCAEAIIRVFHRLGDYKHKQKNRLKFLVRSLGWDGFVTEYERERADLGADHARLPFDPERPPVEEAPTWPERRALALDEIAIRAIATTVIGPGIVPKVEPQLSVHSPEFLEWSRTNVRSQKQDGYAIVVVTTLLGDLTSAQMRLVGELSEVFGDGAVRVTMDQNLVFRWVRTENVEAFYKSLAAAGLARAGAGTLSDVTSCPGAESCKLAVTQSRGLGRVLADHLMERQDIVAALPGMDIKISGCPNGCGQHHIAGIGLQGSVRQVGGRAAPQYFVMVGGGVHADGARFARLAAKVPARRLTQAFDRLFELYLRDRDAGESARAYFTRVELTRVKAALAELEALPAEAAGPEDFVDLGEAGEFKVEKLDGECSA
jgi:sulfite reductase (NADPH) hemoprotein beta-component